jgi:hypothetical protein
MIVNPHLHGQYALQRQQRLRDEAAAHRLAELVPARTRLARFLRRQPNQPAAGRVGKPLTQRN